MEQESIYTKEYLLNQLKKYFGFYFFRDQQIQIIQSILQKKDTLVIMPTGGGKSLCYQLPALLQEGTTLVVSPLIALMKNQVDFLKRKGIKAAYLNSSLSQKATRVIHKELLEGELKFLYIAPETLNKEATIELLTQNSLSISFLAIDEAHCISDWGHDFRPEYRNLKSTIEKLGRIPTIAVTATATHKVRQDIINNLQLDDPDIFISSFDRPNLYYEVRTKRNTEKLLIQFIKGRPNHNGVIYCQSRKKVEEVSTLLQRNGIKAAIYHAGLDNKTRIAHQDAFLEQKINVIVATIAFGMGIDKPDVRFVIHYDSPKSLEGYYQETGRAGRDGQPSDCLLLYNVDDIIKLQKLNRNKPVAEEKHNNTLLNQVRYFAESGLCRRKQLLHYFGETYTAMRCDHCDNCQHPTSTYNGKKEVLMLLQTFKALKSSFNFKHLVHIMTGIKDPYVESHNHHLLKYFGKGEAMEQTKWQSILRQIYLLGYLQKDPDELEAYTLSEKGSALLKAPPQKILLAEDRDYTLEGEAEEEEKVVEVNQELLAALKDLRKKEAQKRDVKPYWIFQEHMLNQMATLFPTDLSQLSKIPGINSAKANKYGAPFIKLILTFIKVNNITVKDQIIIKPNTAKFSQRIQIIQQIDHKIPLEEIAKTHKISHIELIKELEEIGYSGIKLNLTHYLDQTLSEEEQEDLYDYFYEQATDNIERALEELQEDGFLEHEIRLLRLHFFNEVVI